MRPSRPVDAAAPRPAGAWAEWLRGVMAAMGWRVGALELGSDPDPEIVAALRGLSDAPAPEAAAGTKPRPVEVFAGGRAASLAHLAAARARLADGARLLLVGGIAAEEARAALGREGLDPVRTHVYVAEAASPRPRLLLCDAPGTSRVEETAAQPRVRLARDVAAVLAGRRLMMRGAARDGDHGRAAAARWAAHHALPPEEGVEVREIAPMVRLYRPPGTSPGTPPGMLPGARKGTIVYLHGGGMVYYDLDVFASFMMRLAAGTGREVLAFGYDKLPETPAPDAVDGLMARIARHLPEEEGLAVAGDSIGGLLALYAAARVLLGRFAHAVLVYPVLSLARTYPSYEVYGEGHLLDASAMRWFRSLLAPTFAARGFDPMRLVPGEPAGTRLSVVSAGCDVLADEAAAFTAARPGIVRIHCPDMPHDFCLNAGKLASARAAVERIVSLMT